MWKMLPLKMRYSLKSGRYGKIIKGRKELQAVNKNLAKRYLGMLVNYVMKRATSKLMKMMTHKIKLPFKLKSLRKPQTLLQIK
jgi:hypothetical protein